MTVETKSGAYDGNGSNSPQWWPSRYGADDLIGAANELTSDRTLEALKLPQEGRKIELAQLLTEDVPAFPPRFWKQTVLAHVPAPVQPLVLFCARRPRPVLMLDFAVRVLGRLRLYRPQRFAAQLRRVVEQLRVTRAVPDGRSNGEAA